LDSLMKVFIRLARAYLKPYWTRIALSICLTCVSSMAPFVFSFMGKTIVDDVLEIATTPPKPPELDPSDPVSPYAHHSYANAEPERRGLDDVFIARTGKTSARKLKLLGIFFIAYITIHATLAALRWISWYNTSIIGQKIVFRMRTDLHDKLQSLQMTYFDQIQTGKIMARVIDDVDVIRTNVTNTVIMFATNLTMLAVGCVILYSINWRMALVATCCLPLYGLSYQFFVRRVREATRKIREINSRTYGYLQQKISGIRVVKSFTQEKMELLRYRRLAREYFQTVMRRDVFHILLGGIATIISGAGTAFVLWYGASLVRDGSLSLGEMLFFHATVGCLFSPVIQISDTNVVLQWLVVVIQRVFDVLDEEVTIKDQPGAVKVADMRGLIEFRNVNLKYKAPDPKLQPQESADRHGHGHDHHGHHHPMPEEKETEPQPPKEFDLAIKDINLAIQPGQMVAITGASGSGKTSLVLMLLRLYEPTDGQILIDGRDVRTIRLTSLRRHVSLVPQESAIFSGTIADNIRYGEPYAPLEAVVAAATAAEIHPFIDELPDKYDTKVGEQGVSLSGGQKQRVSIARALLTDPSVLILDDCTSALDAETEARIQQTLQRVLHRRTSIVITHRTSMAMKADKIIVLDKGRIVEEGRHDELLANRGYYWRIYSSQQKGMAKAG